MRAMSKCAVATVLVTAAILTAAVLPGAQARAPSQSSDAFNWQVFTIDGFGTQVDYPAGIFAVSEGKSEIGLGERLRSADGRALLTVYSRENDTAETPASYLKNNLRLPHAALDYARITPTFFAISSVRQGMIYYSRCNFSSEMSGAVHCFDLVYPQREQRAWDPIVTRISRSLRPLEHVGM
jgi:hypothetical protein